MPAPPKINRCEREKKDGHKCENNSMFNYLPTRDRDGTIIEWEIECPMCGSIWWVSVKPKAEKPQLYKK